MSASGRGNLPSATDADNLAGSANQQVDARLYVMHGDTTWQRTRESAALGDGALGVGMLGAGLHVNNGSTFDRMRTPSVFKTLATSTTGATALWTPTAGKKFRVMRYQIGLTGDAARAAAGNVTVKLQDSATDIGVSAALFVPNAAGTVLGGFVGPWMDLGNGFLSAAANNVLNLNLSSALTSGAVWVNVCGTEE